jgi:segregation and condensation protein B
MQPHELPSLLEALLFAADQPITAAALAKAVDDPEVTAGAVTEALEALGARYAEEDRGFKLVRLGNGWQMVTHERYAPWVKALLAGRQKARLSRAALETAAVIAYKQPITRLGIERIRGVDAGGVLNTLLERGLIMIKGRDPGPGRPLLYGTTQGFLDYFGLAKLSELPRMDEIAALARAEGAWNEDERIRLERHGIAAEEESPVPVSAAAAAGIEEGAPPDMEDAREVDRHRFQEVVSDLTAADLGSSVEDDLIEEPESEPEHPGSLHP